MIQQETVELFGGPMDGQECTPAYLERVTGELMPAPTIVMPSGACYRLIWRQLKDGSNEAVYVFTSGR